MVPPKRDPEYQNLFPEERRLRLWPTLRSLTRGQWLYLPRLFSRAERIGFSGLLLIALITLGIFSTRLYISATVERPAVAGILREGITEEPHFINPLYASSEVDRAITDLVFSKLVHFDQKGAIQMDLAQSVDLGDDGKTYLVHLKPNVQWHDGEKFSADDVLFTLKAIQDPEYKSVARQNWQGVSVEKLDDQTIRLTLRQPYAPFMENLAVSILPEHIWRKIPRESVLLSDFNLKPVGTGPYKFDKFTRRADGSITTIELLRNSTYHQSPPFIERIRFAVLADEEKLVTAYRRNEIDAAVIIDQTLIRDLASLDSTIHALKLPKIFAVFLNSSAAPALGRKAVREALASSIDRNALLSRLASGGGEIVNSAIPPGSLGFAPDTPEIPYNPEHAKALLATDGWKDSDQDGVLDRSEGTGKKKVSQKLALTITTSDVAELNQAAQRIAEMWRVIGVKVDVRVLPIGELETTMIRPRAYEALLFGEVFGHDPDPFAFWHTSQLKDPGLNIAQYSSPKVDQLLEEARRTSDSASRAQKYQEFQKIVSQEIGAIFLYSPTTFYVLRNTIAGVEIGSVSLPEERFNTITNWYTDTHRTLR